MANNTHLGRRRVRLQGIRDAMSNGEVWTALRLAKLLTASERTIYRDMELLIGDGCPIVGAAGVGFVWKPTKTEVNDG